jgi:hypothetical protein
MSKRPISVTLLAALLIVACEMGIVYHFTDFRSALPGEYFGVLAIRLLAIVCGLFLLRGKDWARWLAMGWIAFHVGLSYFHSMQQMAMHAVVLVVFAVVLFRPTANRYFSGSEAGTV